MSTRSLGVYAELFDKRKSRTFSPTARLRLRINCDVTGPVIQRVGTGIVATPWEAQAVVQDTAVVPLTSNNPQEEGLREEASRALASQDPQMVQGAAAVPVTSGQGGVNVGNEGLPSAQNVLNFIAFKCFQEVDPSKPDELNGFLQYLKEVREVLIVDTQSGSLIITVQCVSVQILDDLWEDYSTGHLNQMAQKFLVTEEILKELSVIAVTLTTTILREEYNACREYLLKHPGRCGNLHFHTN